MFSAPFLSTLLDRVKAVVRRVARPVAERVRPGTCGAALPVRITPAMHGLMQGWLAARLRALSALMDRIRAGDTLAARVRAPRPARTVDAAVVRDAVPPEERLPRGFGWMCGFGPDVRGDGAAFAAWLSEPAMQAMVLAAPERMAKRIGPILTATGQRRPEWFPVVAKRTRGQRVQATGCAESLAPGSGTAIAGDQIANPALVDDHTEPEIEGGPWLAPTSSAGVNQPSRPPPPSREVAGADSHSLVMALYPLTQRGFSKTRRWVTPPMHAHFVTIS
jgi:hypothetical protein